MRKYTVEKVFVESEGYSMKLLIVKPTIHRKPAAQTPGVLWIHGGGYVVGMASMIYMSRAMALVKKYGAVVVTPEYRLAGQAPYPAALKDCYAALTYMKEHAQELGCNPDQLMVGGESAGGGLTVALCMYARDHEGVRIAYQMPLYPMLDDRDTPSSKRNAITWNYQNNYVAWKKYLADVKGEVPVYAAPARCTDYRGLPPAYSIVGEKEAFYCETLTYIENLQKAGVEAHVDVYPIGVHAFDMVMPHLPVSRRAIREFERQFQYAVGHYYAEQS